MNDKLIMKDSKPHKIAEVVMLPTKEQRWKIGNEHDDRYEFYSFVDKKLYSRQSNAYNWSLSHLYILSSEEIKEGDWYIRNGNELHQDKGEAHGICDCKKIIATTDESLEIACKVECHDCNGKGEQIMPYKDNGEVCSRCSGTGLEDNEKPFLRPSDDFLKAFVKAQGKGFSKIIVEYDYNCQTCDPAIRGWCCQEPKNLKLKVAPDNTITIKPFEEKASWNKEEVIEILKKFDIEMGDTHGPTTRNKWIEENL